MTGTDEQVVQLLREIRDLQAEHLRLYRAELDQARRREADGTAALQSHVAEMNAAARRELRGRLLFVGVGVAFLAAVLVWVMSVR